MTDFHCHIKTKNALYANPCLLPQNYTQDNEERFFGNPDGIPEIGLDKRYPDFEKQLKTFSRLFEKIIFMKMPVALHCVTANNEMFETIKNTGFENGSVLWHNFTSSVEFARQLTNAGILISISARYKKNINGLYESNIPFVLESDYDGTDDNEQKKTFETHCKNTAASLNITFEQLEKLCNENGKLFKNRCSAWF